jgi:hypothetical protein
MEKEESGYRVDIGVPPGTLRGRALLLQAESAGPRDVQKRIAMVMQERVKECIESCCPF